MISVLLACVLAQETPWSVDPAEGLRYRSGDGEFEFHAGGRFIEQFRQISGRPGGRRTEPNTFTVREAFLQLDGTVLREFRFQAAWDFAGGSDLEQAFIEWKRTDAFGLRVGQVRQPAGQEGLTSTLFTDCIERSNLNRFVPGLEPGAMASGELEGGLLGYQASLWVRRGDEREALVRVTTMPFVAEPEFILRRLRLGVTGSAGDADEISMATEFDVTTTELSVTFLDSTAGLLDGRRLRAGMDLSWEIGPASVRGEVLWRRDEVRDAADRVEERLRIWAWYGQVSCILFGAEKIAESRLTPVRPFDLSEGHGGAFELVFRASGAAVGSEEFVAVGNSLVGQSGRVLVLTGGFNWYPVRNVRLSANLVHEDYGREIGFSSGVTKDRLFGLLVRFQVDF